MFFFRTDFFVVAPPEGGRVGFPPGLAAKLVISKFKKWADYKTSQKTNEPPPSYLEATSEDTARCQSLPVVHDVEVPHYNQSKKEESIKPSESTPVGSIKKPDSCKKKEPQKVAPAKPPRAVPLADTYNGRKTDKYSWSQSIKELDIYIVVDKNVKNKKNVKVDIQKDKIRVSTGTGAEDEVVTDWHLPHPIIKDESYWSLHPGESVFLSLQKVKEMWWDHLFEGEEILDRKKIDAVRPMEELEDEEQAKIQELVWNQEQKLKGLPTSEESVSIHCRAEIRFS